MQRYVHWLAPLIALGVAAYIALFLVRVNRTEPMPDITPVQKPSDKQAAAADRREGWIGALAEHERQGYFYPVSEIYVKVDLNQRLVNEKIFRLSAQLRDPYQLFCLEQELKKHALRYTMRNEKTGAELLIYAKDRSHLDALVESLKHYQIAATTLPYQEDQRWKNIK
jgi:hypothetical protein